MTFLSLLLFEAIYIGLGSAQFTCESYTSASAPFTLNETLAPSQNCLYVIEIPSDDGIYPLLDITVTGISSSDTLSLSGQGGLNLEPAGGKTEFSVKTAALPTKNIVLTIKTGSSTSMQVDIIIDAKKVNLTASQQNATVNTNEQAISQSLSSLTSGGNYFYQSTTSGKVVVSLLAHPVPEESSKLMGFFIYENKVLKGSLYQHQKKPYISEGNDVSIFMASDQTDAKSLLLIQNGDNINNVDNFETRWQYDLNSEGEPSSVVIPLPGSLSKPAVVTVGDLFNMTYCYLDVNFTDSSTILDVYAGTLASDEFKLERYNFQNEKTALPQRLPGSLKTFVLYGSGSIKLIPNVNDTAWTEAYAGRRGFLMTETYPFLASYTVSSSLEFHLKNASQQLLFTMEAPKGDSNSYWIIKADGGRVAQSGSYNESGSVVGNSNFSANLYVSASGTNTGAFARWNVAEVPPTTTTVTTPATTTNTTVATNQTTTELVQATTPEFPQPDVFLNCNQTTFDLADAGIAGNFTVTESCNYTINIPAGFGAQISIYAGILGQNETLTMYNDYGDVLNTVNQVLEASVTWVGDHFHIDAVIEPNSRNLVTLSVKKANITRAGIPREYNLTVEGPQIFGSFGPLQKTVIRSNSKVYISSATPEVYNDASSILIYEGEGATAILVGSLYGLVPSNSSWTSNGTTVTLQNAANETINNFAKYVFNEADVVNPYASYSTMYLLNTRWNFVLDAKDGSTAVTMINDPENHINFVINDYNIQGSASVLSIYSTPLRRSMNGYLLASYTNSTVMQNVVPQDIPTYVRTFVLSSGTASMSIISGPLNETTWTRDVTDGKTGRIMTPNYNNPLHGDETVPYVVTLNGDGNKYNFELRVLSADSSCLMTYSVKDGSNRWSSNSSTTLKDQIISGYSLELQIYPGNENSTGALLSYSVVKSGPVLTASLILLILSIFL